MVFCPNYAIMFHKTCISVYFSLFYSFILYDSLAWQFTSKTNLNRVFILQKKCLRIITFSFYKDHSNPLFKDLKALIHNVSKWSDTRICILYVFICIYMFIQICIISFVRVCSYLHIFTYSFGSYRGLIRLHFVF